MDGQCHFEDAEDTFRISIPLGQDVRAKGICVMLKGEDLSIGLSGSLPALRATLPGKVESDWQIVEKNGQRMLAVELEKTEQERWELPPPQTLPAVVEIVVPSKEPATQSEPELRQARATELYKQGELDKAIAELRPGKGQLDAAGSRLLAAFLYEAATKNINEGKSPAAKEQLDEAIPLVEGKPSMLLSTLKVTIAQVYKQQYKLRLSEEALTAALPYLEFRAKSSSSDKLGADHDAMAHMKHAKLLRSEINMDLGNIQECLAELQDLVDAEPGNQNYSSRLATALLDLVGDQPRALRVLTAMNTSTASVFSLYQTAACAFAMEDWPLAQKYSEIIRSREPTGAPRDIREEHERKAFRDGMRCAWLVAKKQKNVALAEELEQKLNSWCRAERQRQAYELFGKEVVLDDTEPIDSTWDYVSATPPGQALAPSLFYATYQILAEGMKAASETPGLIMELGVYHGKSMREIAAFFPDEVVHGFDSFQGLPEQWIGNPVGAYSTHGEIPPMPDNVRLHVGLFSDTLPGFLEEHKGPVRFVNLDCDLYSSTKDILDQIHPRIVVGSIIFFDVYVGVRNWQDHQYKAFQEAVKQYGWGYEYVAISILSNRAIIRVTSIDKP
mmetsp:Transcript_69225/g.129214  ORF Transcript_69225/g.129214 Transcript_69225/m.129214 type:complete len:616 (-) Transcript_69225:118-1965(-)